MVRLVAKRPVPQEAGEPEQSDARAAVDEAQSDTIVIGLEAVGPSDVRSAASASSAYSLSMSAAPVPIAATDAPSPPESRASTAARSDRAARRRRSRGRCR